MCQDITYQKQARHKREQRCDQDLGNTSTDQRHDDTEYPRAKDCRCGQSDR